MHRAVLLLSGLALLPQAVAWAQEAAPAAEGTMARSNRMEFDERLIKGQTAQSGAVYLFKRVPRQLPGLVGLRRSYRARIVRPVLHDRKINPFVKQSAEAPEATVAPADAQQAEPARAKQPPRRPPKRRKKR